MANPYTMASEFFNDVRTLANYGRNERDRIIRDRANATDFSDLDFLATWPTPTHSAANPYTSKTALLVDLRKIDQRYESIDWAPHVWARLSATPVTQPSEMWMDPIASVGDSDTV